MRPTGVGIGSARLVVTKIGIEVFGVLGRSSWSLTDKCDVLVVPTELAPPTETDLTSGAVLLLLTMLVLPTETDLKSGAVLVLLTMLVGSVKEGDEMVDLLVLTVLARPIEATTGLTVDSGVLH